MSPLGPPIPPLAARLGAASPLDGFVEYVESEGISLYPAQEEALLEILDGRNVIMNTPTGSGKSLVAPGPTSPPSQPGAAACTPPR